jgi:hypothetical protein
MHEVKKGSDFTQDELYGQALTGEFKILSTWTNRSGTRWPAAGCGRISQCPRPVRHPANTSGSWQRPGVRRASCIPCSAGRLPRHAQRVSGYTEGLFCGARQQVLQRDHDHDADKADHTAG